MIEALFTFILMITISIGSYRLFMNSFLSMKNHITAFERARRELSHQPTERAVQEGGLTLLPLESLYGEPK